MDQGIDQEAFVNFTGRLSQMFDTGHSTITQQELFECSILVVDDDPLNVDVLEEILKGNGYQDVVTTIDPYEAVELFKQREFDLILLDILMPGMDGFAVMEEFKKNQKGQELSVLILSALSDQKTRLRALSSGARDYLIKPFNADEVLVRIRNLLEVRLSQKQLRMHNELLDQKVRERTKELQDTRLEIINRLGIAAEYRDEETGLHIVRMSRYSHEVAKAAGLNKRGADLILHASPMHDIGKIGIPDNILLKPGKLTEDEWTTMKTHTLIGARILEGHESDLIGAATTIAMTHHEKWNGQGYPNGLSRQDIPLMGRIVALADAFDALTSVRPYKEAWTVEKTMSVMEGDAGTHFDPMLFKTFKACLPAILKIKDQYKDKKVNTGVEEKKAEKTE